MTGKNKCKILKDIRRQIAIDNNIDLVVEECKFKGECTGTCPRCEAEVAYLEKELAKRKKLGQSIALAGIAATIVVSSTGCNILKDLSEKIKSTSTTGIIDPTVLEEQSNENCEVLEGDVAWE